MTGRIGLAISTQNRRHIFTKTLLQYQKYTPRDIVTVVVDDCSDAPVRSAFGARIIRNETIKGVARVKNQGIAALLDAGCDHIFLSDDDCYPSAQWWQPYVQSGEHHLSLQQRQKKWCQKCCATTMYNYDCVPGRLRCSVCHPGQQLYEDDKIHAVAWGSGAFLYFTRECIQRIGGFRTEYGRYGIEHWDIGIRARNVGMTRFAFQDILNPALHATDALSQGRRSCVPRDIRTAQLKKNWEIFQKYQDSKEFVPYTEPDPTQLATVAMPWRPAPQRQAAQRRCVKYWQDHGYTVIAADSTEHGHQDPGFLCSKARNNAVAQTDTSIVIIADADTLPANIDQITDAVLAVNSGNADAIWPFTEYRHIPNGWVTKEDLTHAPIQQSYINSPGGIVVIRTQTFWDIGGYDERFTPGLSANGSCYGYDDTAFLAAASTLCRVERIDGIVYSFNHAVNAAGKPDRNFGPTNPNKARFRLYESAKGKPEAMRQLTTK